MCFLIEQGGEEDVLKSFSKQLSVMRIVVFLCWVVTVNCSMSSTRKNSHLEILWYVELKFSLLMICHCLWRDCHSPFLPSFCSSVLPPSLPPSCLLVLWETHVERFSFHREWWPSLFTEFSKLMWSVSNSWVWIRYFSFSVSNGKNLFHKQEYKSSSQFLLLNLFILITWLFH